MKDITWHVTLHVVYSFNLIFPVDILHVSNYDFSNTKLPARNIMFPLSLFAFRVSLCAFFGLFFFISISTTTMFASPSLSFSDLKRKTVKSRNMSIFVSVYVAEFSTQIVALSIQQKNEKIFFFFLKKKKIGIECFEKFNFFWTVFDIFFRIYSTLLSCSLEI